MVQFTLPKNSRVTPGKVWPKPHGAAQLKEFRIYRWDPGRGSRATLAGRTPLTAQQHHVGAGETASFAGLRGTVPRPRRRAAPGDTAHLDGPVDGRPRHRPTPRRAGSCHEQT